MEFLLRPLRTSRLFAGLLATLLACGGPVCLAATPSLVFNIPAGTAAAALNSFSLQSNLQIVFDFDAVKNLTTRGVSGTMTPESALAQMLLGSNFVFEFVNGRTIAITRRGEALPNAPVPPKAAGARPAIRPMSAPQPAAAADLDEIVVTGTHIRGVAPIGDELITIDRDEIDRSGYATVEDIVRALPQNFGGGPSQDTFQIGLDTRTNSYKGTGFNLRGLGSGETLVLLDERRMAPGGTAGAFVDVSNIPLTAIERIELVPDGGSALYGADAIGGVVNIVLRHVYTGPETVARVASFSGGSPGQLQASQMIGTKWAGGDALLSVEYFQQDTVPAADRLQATSDLTGFGGQNFDTLQSNPGNIVIGNETYAIPTGQNGRALKPSQLVAGTENLEDLWRGTDITPEQRRWSVVGSAQTAVSDVFKLSVEGLFTDRTAEQNAAGARLTLPVTDSNPFYVNPTGGKGPIAVSYDFLEDLGSELANVEVKTGNFAIGAEIGPGSDWHLNGYLADAFEKQSLQQTGVPNEAALEAALADPNPATAFNPFGAGSNTNPATLAAIASESFVQTDSEIRSVDVTADGRLRALPAGDMKIAIGADFRHEALDSAVNDFTVGQHTASALDRRVSAVFAELLVPIFGGDFRRPGLRALELSLAARHDDYSDLGSTTTPRVGLAWSPSTELKISGGWARSFKAPALADLSETSNQSTLDSLPDNRAPGGSTTALIWVGNDADLKEETARTWTFGTAYSPESLPGAHLALNYFDVSLRNQIESYELTNNFLEDPLYTPFITLDPSQQQRSVVCGHSAFVGLPGQCLTTPIGALIDLRLANGGRLRTRGFDLNAQYQTSNSLGHFTFGVNGTYAFDYAESTTPTAPVLQLINTQSEPLRVQLRGSLTWERGRLGTTAGVSYAGGYHDIGSVPERSVDAWTTVDLQLRYDLASRGWLTHTRIFLSVQNLFAKDPPFLNNQLGIGYDAENADLIGRIISLQVRERW